MANIKNISHLKVGKAISADPHYTAKTQGAVYNGNAKHVERHPTPDSQPKANDGELQGNNSPDGRASRVTDGFGAGQTHLRLQGRL